MAAPLGNKNGAKGKVWSDAVRKALLSGKKLDTVAKKLVDMACDGDIQAIKEIGDRLDGKAVQGISGADGGPITVELIKQFAHPDTRQ